MRHNSCLSEQISSVCRFVFLFALSLPSLFLLSFFLLVSLYLPTIPLYSNFVPRLYVTLLTRQLFRLSFISFPSLLSLPLSLSHSVSYLLLRPSLALFKLSKASKVSPPSHSLYLAIFIRLVIFSCLSFSLRWAFSLAFPLSDASSQAPLSLFLSSPLARTLVSRRCLHAGALL